jgi:mRNA interferase MazF
MTYNSYDVVTVPFPFTDKTATKKRPALVLSKQEYQCKTGHLILLMITSANNSSWSSDIQISDLSAVGLKNPSVIRFKMFSLDERLIIKKIGNLSELDRQKVKEILFKTLDI